MDITFSLSCVSKCELHIHKDTNKDHTENITISKFLKKHKIIYFPALIDSIITSKIKWEKYELRYTNFVIIKTKDFLKFFSFLLKQNLHLSKDIKEIFIKICTIISFLLLKFNSIFMDSHWREIWHLTAQLHILILLLYSEVHAYYSDT